MRSAALIAVSPSQTLDKAAEKANSHIRQVVQKCVAGEEGLDTGVGPRAGAPPRPKAAQRGLNVR